MRARAPHEEAAVVGEHLDRREPAVVQQRADGDGLLRDDEEQARGREAARRAERETAAANERARAAREAAERQRESERWAPRQSPRRAQSAPQMPKQPHPWEQEMERAAEAQLHAEEVARLKEELAAARRHTSAAQREAGAAAARATAAERDAAGARDALERAKSAHTRELTRVDAEGGRLRRELAASERARREAEEEATKLRRYFEAKDGPGAPLQAGGSAKKRPRSAAEAGPSEDVHMTGEEEEEDDEADLLVLEPIDRGPPAVDCRKPIEVPLPADDDASLTMGRTKHQDKGKDADFGIEDVRVSRNHIRVARKVGGAPTLTVLAPTNPVAYCEANSNERQLLTKGQVCELADGDQVRLVVEDHVKAEGNSEKFAGNPCAYQVHLYRRGVRLSAERRAAAKRVRRSSGRLAQSPRNQHWPR